jgi:threonyl-tRNA synthetase
VTDAEPYALELAEALRARGLAVVTDVRNEKINAKIREHSLHHVPVIAVVGRKEAEERTVTLRRLGQQAQQSDTLDAIVEALALEATPPDLMRSSTLRASSLE